MVHPYESVEFPSEGAVLRGRLYRAAEASRPAVVMTHATSATITMAIDAYAEAIFAAGYTSDLRRVRAPRPRDRSVPRST